MCTKLLTALFIGLMPSLALAEGCSDHDQQAMSCAEGTIWDYKTQACVTQSLT